MILNRVAIGKAATLRHRRLDIVTVRDDAARRVRARLRHKLPSSVYRSLQGTSKRFYEKLFGSR